MRHLNKKFILGRLTAERRALMRSLAENLVLREAIKTTKTKARALRIVMEPLITKAKKNTLASRRAVIKVLYTEKAVKKMMEVIGPRYAQRNGGYLRIIKINRRPNDAAEVVRVEFV